MRRIVNAQNGTIEFNDDEDFEIWPAFLNSSGVWAYVGGDHPKYVLKPYDQIMAVHVFGKNTAVSPRFALQVQLREHQGAWATGDTRYYPFSLYANTFDGLIDINWIFDWKNSNSILTDQFPRSLLDLKIEDGADFTGYLYANFYIKKNVPL